MNETRRGPTTPRPTRHPDDTETHIERLNSGGNPADGTGASPGAAPGAPPKPADPADYGPKRLYRTLADTVLGDGTRLMAGNHIQLHDHEVGAHHELVEDVGHP